MTKQEEIKKKPAKWCPQHGYPEPCVKCNGMTLDEWEEFSKSLAKAVGVSYGN